MVASQAVLIAVGIDWEGRRQILAVDMANRESSSSWKDFLLGLRRRGLRGVEFVVADDHAGLRAAIREVLPETAVQRCYVHFLRNALDHLPRKADDDCLQELRWLYDRRNVEEGERDPPRWRKVVPYGLLFGPRAYLVARVRTAPSRCSSASTRSMASTSSTNPARRRRTST